MKIFTIKLFITIAFTSLLVWAGLSIATESVTAVKVKPGIEVLLSRKLELVRGKRIGLITNPTGVTATLQSTIDVLYQHKDVQLVALFGPEHGVRGDVFAGAYVQDYKDDKTGIPVFSLYGKTRKPTKTMLANIDLLVYDIQDIGSRAYTYIYTMALAMEAAKEHNLPFLVLDRPNPLGGNLIEGPVLEPKFKSFIGMYPIPYLYGLTVGELAQLFNTEFGIKANLQVLPMEGWSREMTFDQTGLAWIPTSPHIPHAITAFFCATVGCIGELHSVNEGVGYTSPFELIGAPWIGANDLADELNRQNLPGVYFRPLHYQPYYFAFKDQKLQGVQIHILDIDKFRPMATQIHILCALKKLYPNQPILAGDRVTSFNQAMGTDTVVKAIEAGTPAGDIMSSWQPDVQKFMKTREKYLIY